MENGHFSCGHDFQLTIFWFQWWFVSISIQYCRRDDRMPFGCYQHRILGPYPYRIDCPIGNIRPSWLLIVRCRILRWLNYSNYFLDSTFLEVYCRATWLKLLTVTVFHFSGAPFWGGFFKIIFVISCSSVSVFTSGWVDFWVWVWTTVFTFSRVVSAVWSFKSGFHAVKEIGGTFLRKQWSIWGHLRSFEVISGHLWSRESEFDRKLTVLRSASPCFISPCSTISAKKFS